MTGAFRTIAHRLAARLFGKSSAPRAIRPIPTPPPGDSSEEWSVGDLAECISEYGDWICRRTGHVLEGGGPQYRETYRVITVDVLKDSTGLTFARWPGLAFSALAFRKITPRADEARAGTCSTLKNLLSLAPQTDEVA